MAETKKIVEVDAYVLPTVGPYSVFVDVDIDEYSKKHGKNPHELKIRVFSPEDLDEGELARIIHELQRKWSRYIVEREQPRKIYRWFRVFAPIELLLLIGIVYNDYQIVPPPTSYIRLGWAIFFWGLIFGFTVIIPGLRSFRTKRREDRAKKLLKNWKGTKIAEGTDKEKKERVKELRDYFPKLKGRETEMYEKLKNYSKQIELESAFDFYEWKIKDLLEEESFRTKYLPASFGRKMKNFLFGVKVESPKVVAPVRNMDISPPGGPGKRGD